MRIQKSVPRYAHSAERDLSSHQQAILAATAVERHNAWAVEMLARRNAVARWRGQPPPVSELPTSSL
jgi:hypothetical protein